LPPNANQIVKDEAIKMINEGYGCRVFGFMDVPKVPGKLIMMTDAVQTLFLELSTGDDAIAKEAFSKFSFDHYFKNLSFGDSSQRDTILQKFAEYPEHTNFDMVSEHFDKNKQLYTFEPEVEHFNNFKFAVIVPHTFIDETQRGSPTIHESFSYSFTQNRKKADPQYLM